ncbi:MAG: DUF6691 family protein [Bradymonadia bacterium]
MKQPLVAFVAGVVFAVGLALSGMTEPAKVIGFLDFTGTWDPSLVFVMGGAVMVTFVLFRLIWRRGQPVLAGRFHLPTRNDVDGRLLGGAALFGVGWGLGGYCPGPAIASTSTATSGLLVFLGAMLGGMYAFKLVDWARARRRAGTHSAETAVSQASSV